MRVNTKVDLRSLLSALDKLEGAKESLSRKMGVAGGVVIRDRAKELAPVGTEQGGSKRPGLLRDAIYLAFSDARSSTRRVVYSISWNSKKAPHGHLLEFGHWMPYLYGTDGKGNYWTIVDKQGNPVANPNGPVWVNAHPFLAPAFDSTKKLVYDAAIDEGKRSLPEILRGRK